MPLRYDNPREIGADRLVNAVAAYDKIRDAVVVVDFGTAITYDPVSAKGEYLGGIIAPGSRSRWTRSPSARPAAEDRPRPAAPADRQDDGRRDHGPASSTATPVRSTAIRAAAARRDGGGDPHHRTGGHATIIAPFTETIDEVDDLLTLTGLRLLHERNSV